LKFQIFCAFFLLKKISAENAVDFWNIERPSEMATIQSLEVMCGKTFMEVKIKFDRVFNGIIFSKGAIDQYNCIYVKPQTGSVIYSFNIMYNKVKFILSSFNFFVQLEFIVWDQTRHERKILREQYCYSV